MKEKKSQRMRWESVFVFDGVVSMWMTRELDDRAFEASDRPCTMPGLLFCRLFYKSVGWKLRLRF